MESGYVDFFLATEGKLFGFLITTAGERLFFHYSGGQAVEIKGPGEVKWVRPTGSLRFPKKGEYLMFERGRNSKGIMASPWCFLDDHEDAVRRSKRELTLDEAKQRLSQALCKVFEYTDTSCPNGVMNLTIRTTEITWLGGDGKCAAAKGTYVTTTESYKYSTPETKTKARVEVFTPSEKPYTSCTVFTGEHATQLNRTLNVQSSVKGVRVGILWNGGWDDYVVDPASLRDMTDEERHCSEGGLPTVGQGGWLSCRFARNVGADHQAVQILRSLGGGD